MKILTPAEIKKPRSQLVIETGETTRDWQSDQEFLGGAAEREILCPKKDYTAYITEYELQRNDIFDAFDCVTQGFWNGYQVIANMKFGTILNKSKRYTAVKGGTQPRRGANVNTIAETIRKIGGVPEEVWPSMSPTMTEAEFYKSIPAEIDKKEDFLKNGWQPNHEWARRASPWVQYSDPDYISDMLVYSPIVVAVDGDYRFNANGELMWGIQGENGRSENFVEYTHVVLLVKDDGKRFYVLDSENPNGLMPVERIYKFGACKLIHLTKKKMFRLIKKAGSPAVYFYCVDLDAYFPISDSSVRGLNIAGGDVLKTFSGTYKNAAIEVVGDIPADKILGEIKINEF